MVDEQTFSMLDLESAKDKLRQSLTALEKAVETKVKQAEEKATHEVSGDSAAISEEFRQELLNAKSHLEKVTTEKRSLQEEKQRLEDELQAITHAKQLLAEKNKEVKDKVDRLIFSVEQAIENKEVQHANS